MCPVPHESCSQVGPGSWRSWVLNSETDWEVNKAVLSVSVSPVPAHMRPAEGCCEGLLINGYRKEGLKVDKRKSFLISMRENP